MLSEQKYDEAIVVFKKVLETSLEEEDVSSGLIETYLGLDDYTSANTLITDQLQKDENVVETWELFIEVKGYLDITDLETSKLYVDAYEASGDETFNTWVMAHTPELPTVNLQSGTYNNVLQIRIFDNLTEIEYKLNGEVMPCEKDGSKVPVYHGHNEFKLTVTNEWGLTAISEYVYDINNEITFEDTQLEAMFKTVLNLEDEKVNYRDIYDISTIVIAGNHMKFSRGFGPEEWIGEAISKNNYDIDHYFIDNKKSQAYGSITTFDDLKVLSQLNHLEILYNEIPDINFINTYDNLAALVLKYNKVTSLETLDSPKLAFTWLVGNRITDFEFLNRSTALLNFSFDAGYKDIIEVYKMNQQNPIITVENLDAMLSLGDLERLSLEGVNLTNGKDDVTLSMMTRITGLSLKTCGIKNIEFIKNLTNLKTISLENNDISSVKDFGEFTQIDYLSLVANKIYDHSTLKSIDISTLYTD